MGNLFVLMNTVIVEDKLDPPPDDPPPDDPPPDDPPPEKPDDPPPEKPKKPSKKPPVVPPSENTPVVPLSSDNPATVSAEQEDEKKPVGILASPRTGDSSMVVLWFTVLMLSIAGIIELAKHYCVGKRGDE